MSFDMTTIFSPYVPVPPPAGKPTRACPACGGLDCLERPRFFAGQLITEAELNGDQAYVLAKNRLHNRYLHGAGVVCGLSVVCDDCEGWVRVTPGYAIDPCGNDIVVCDEQRVPVAELIAKCRDVRTGRADCDPVRTEPSHEGDCTGREEHWCVTIAYAEREARASTVLRGDTVSTRACTCGSGCGCRNGNGNGGCGCNGHGHAVSVSYERPYADRGRAARTMPEARSRTIGACEPTRVVEGFKLDVCEGSVGLCRTPFEAIRSSLLWEVVGCVFNFATFFQKRVPSQAMSPIVGAMFTQRIEGKPQDLFDSYSYFRQALYELNARDPLRVGCDLKETLDAIAVQAPPAGEDDVESYSAQVHVSLQQLVAVSFQYIVDCLCRLLLPPCPPDPLDDRLTLACLTLVDGKITRICNYSCRRHAGAWPTFYRWSTLVPILPIVGVVLEWLCCDPWLRRDLSKNKVMSTLDSFDPTYRRSALYEADFKQISDLVSRLGAVRDNFTRANVATVVSDPQGFASIVRSAFGRGDDD